MTVLAGVIVLVLPFFRTGQLDVFSGSASVGKLLPDRDRSPLEVYAVPCQAQYFSLSHAGKQSHPVQDLMGVSLDLLEKQGKQFLCERVHFLLLYLRQVPIITGIAPDQTVLDCLSHRLVKCPVYILDRLW